MPSGIAPGGGAAPRASTLAHVQGRQKHMQRLLASGIVGEAARYLVVAGSGFVFAIVIFAAQLAIGIGAYIAITVTFVLNGLWNFLGFKLWAFPGAERRTRAQLVRFCVVAGGSLAINYGVFALFYEVVGVPALPAQVLAIGVAAPFGFLMNKLWTFAAGTAQAEAGAAGS